MWFVGRAFLADQGTFGISKIVSIIKNYVFGIFIKLITYFCTSLI